MSTDKASILGRMHGSPKKVVETTILFWMPPEKTVLRTVGPPSEEQIAEHLERTAREANVHFEVLRRGR